MRIHCWISDSTIENFPDSPKRGENGAITRSWGNTLRDPRTDPEADRGGWNGRGKSHGAKKSIERGREPIFAALFFPQCHYYGIAGLAPKYLQQLVLKRSDIHNRHTRNRAPLRIDLPPWNSLPSNIGNRRPFHNWNRPYNIINRKKGVRVNKSFISLILFQLMIMMMNFIQVSRSSSWPGRPTNRGH